VSKRFAIALLGLTLAACGGSSTTQPGPTPAVLIGGTQAIDPGFGVIRTFSIPNVGQLDVTTSWVTATNTVWVEAAPDTCTFDGFVNSTCQFTMFNRDPTNSASKKITVTSHPSGFFALFLANNGRTSETVTFQVTLTK
jgi:hypothetical protein